MEIGSASQNVVSNGGTWKKVAEKLGERVIAAGKMTVGVVADTLIDGGGMPAVCAYQILREMLHESRNIATGKDVGLSCKLFLCDIAGLVYGIPVMHLSGVIIGVMTGLDETQENGISGSVNAGIKLVKEFNADLRRNRELREQRS